jgi:hypothetical protein
MYEEKKNFYTQTTSKVGSCQGVALNLSQAKPAPKQLNLEFVGRCRGARIQWLTLRWQEATFEVVWVYQLMPLKY